MSTRTAAAKSECRCKEIATRAKLDPIEWHLHRFRDTAATRWLPAGIWRAPVRCTKSKNEIGPSASYSPRSNAAILVQNHAIIKLAIHRESSRHLWFLAAPEVSLQIVQNVTVVKSNRVARHVVDVFFHS
jgi:hypothetical protein